MLIEDRVLVSTASEARHGPTVCRVVLFPALVPGRAHHLQADRVKGVAQKEQPSHCFACRPLSSRHVPEPGAPSPGYRQLVPLFPRSGPALDGRPLGIKSEVRRSSRRASSPDPGSKVVGNRYGDTVRVGRVQLQCCAFLPVTSAPSIPTLHHRQPLARPQTAHRPRGLALDGCPTLSWPASHLTLARLRHASF